MAKDLWSIIGQYWWLIAVGIIIMFALVVFDQGIFDQTCCKTAKNIGNKTCDYGSSCGCGGSGWDGQCSPEIEDECCEPIDYCDGQLVENPYDCYHKYCDAGGKSCYPHYNIVTTKYTCGCEYSSSYDDDWNHL